MFQRTDSNRGFTLIEMLICIAILAVPLLSLVIAPTRAAAIMLPLLCLIDLVGLWAYRRHVDRSLLLELLPGALVGIVVGAFVFSVVDVRWIKGLLGIECLIFAVHRLAAARRIDAAPARPRSLARASPWSAISGFTSTLAHAGGPPIMAYLLSRRMPRENFVATSVYFFTAVNLAKLPTYLTIGIFTQATLLTSAVLLPLVPVGVWLGLRILAKIPERPFYWFATAALGLSGAKLLWDGLAAMSLG